MAYQYIVFDDGVKKIARYQQYFAIRATLDRVAQRNAQGTRTGGVIWHTTGSGKSLTMVMLAKALALHPAIRNPRVVLVTDRVDLDRQLWGTFHACGKSVAKAKAMAATWCAWSRASENEARRADVITTVINKFEQAAAQGAGTAASTSLCWWTRATAASTASSTPRCSASSPMRAISATRARR